MFLTVPQYLTVGVCPITWSHPHSPQCIGNVRGAPAELPQCDAVDHVWPSLLCPHHCWAVGVPPHQAALGYVEAGPRQPAGAVWGGGVKHQGPVDRIWRDNSLYSGSVPIVFALLLDGISYSCRLSAVQRWPGRRMRACQGMRTIHVMQTGPRPRTTLQAASRVPVRGAVEFDAQASHDLRPEDLWALEGNPLEQLKVLTGPAAAKLHPNLITLHRGTVHTIFIIAIRIHPSKRHIAIHHTAALSTLRWRNILTLSSPHWTKRHNALSPEISS